MKSKRINISFPQEFFVAWGIVATIFLIIVCIKVL